MSNQEIDLDPDRTGDGVVDLCEFSCPEFDRGASAIKEAFWLVVRKFVFEINPFPWYPLKSFVLRLFGARVGRGVVIKPGVKITFPWKLSVGNHVWLGEDSWLINLVSITIEDSVCISQGAMLCTGNHDFKSRRFNLITQEIHIKRGSWIAANAWVGPGVLVESHAVLCAGSVTNHDLEPYGIYQGNPAVKVRVRHID